MSVLSSEKQVEINQKPSLQYPHPWRTATGPPVGLSKETVWGQTLRCVTACQFPYEALFTYLCSWLGSQTFPWICQKGPNPASWAENIDLQCLHTGDPHSRAAPSPAPWSPMKLCQTLAGLPTPTARGRSEL